MRINSSKIFNSLFLILFIFDFIAVIKLFPYNHFLFWFNRVEDINRHKIVNIIQPLYARGNQIIKGDTDQPIVFRGAVSDYFRYSVYGPEGHWNDDPTGEGINGELKRVKSLQQVGINIMGLYLSDAEQIKLHLAELDVYINYLQDNHIYVYLAPVGHDFSESSDQDPINKDLSELLDTLASRYKNYSNVLYMLAAEPDGLDPVLWNTRQRKLAEIVRQYNPNAVLIITSPYYDLSAYNSSPFPLDNIIYLGGGYISKDDNEFNHKQPDDIENRKDYITNRLDTNKYPVMIGEFGGNWSRDFSSVIDLTMINEILREIQKKNLSYTAYRISPNSNNDQLSLFDVNNNLTQRGQLFSKAFGL